MKTIIANSPLWAVFSLYLFSIPVFGNTISSSCIDQFPYVESFESGFGAWTNATGDDFQWTRYSGGSPSSGTGPSSASDGTFYLYLEASTPNFPSKIAMLEGPCYDLSGQSAASFDFDYHMYGTTVGELRLEVSTNSGSSWTQLWSKSGDQDNSWHTASIDLSTYLGQSNVSLRFWGQTGSNWSSDIAIDKIELTTGGGSGQPCITTVSTYPYSESFETNWGDWTEAEATNFWYRNTNGTATSNTGPSGGASGSYYLYVESDLPNYSYKNGALEGPCFDLTQLTAATFRFHYHLYGADMGQLQVQARLEGESTWNTLWSKGGDQGNYWFLAEVDLTAYLGQTVQLRFYATTSDGPQGDMAVDLLELNSTPVTYTAGCGAGAISTFPYYQSFETDWGLWSERTSPSMWQRNQGATPSGSTGPSGAQSGTWYAFTEASSSNYPHKTGILESPCFDLSLAVSAYFQFYYHMYSGYASDPASMGEVRLEISTNGGNTWSSIWYKEGNQGDNWISETIDLSGYLGETIRLRFYRITGSQYFGDFAIDNLSLNVGLIDDTEDLFGQVIHPAVSSCAVSGYTNCCEPSLSGTNVANIIITAESVDGSNQVQTTSNGSGSYSANLPAGPVRIIPFANSSDWYNGLSTFDIVNLQKHVNRTELIDCPLRRIAGDVDNDGDLDGDDVQTLQDLILNIQTSLADVPNWRFVPKIYLQAETVHPDERFQADFWNPAAENSQGQDYPFKGKFHYDGQELAYNTTDNWMNGIFSWPHYPTAECPDDYWDLYIVKSGDINGSASPTGFSTTPPPQPFVAGNNPTLSTTAISSLPAQEGTPTIDPKKSSHLAKNGNKKYEIRIVASTPVPVEAYQLGLRFDPEVLELGKIKPNKESLALDEARNFGQSKQAGKEGYLRTIWVNDFRERADGLSMAEGLTLFAFEFKTNADLEFVRSAFRLDNAVMTGEFYGANGLIKDIDLQVFIE